MEQRAHQQTALPLQDSLVGFARGDQTANLELQTEPRSRAVIPIRRVVPGRITALEWSLELVDARRSQQLPHGVEGGAGDRRRPREGIPIPGPAVVVVPEIIQSARVAKR